jgi:hypothetical protein
VPPSIVIVMVSNPSGPRQASRNSIRSKLKDFRAVKPSLLSDADGGTPLAAAPACVHPSPREVSPASHVHVGRLASQPTKMTKCGASAPTPQASLSDAASWLCPLRSRRSGGTS